MSKNASSALVGLLLAVASAVVVGRFEQYVIGAMGLVSSIIFFQMACKPKEADTALTALFEGSHRQYPGKAATHHLLTASLVAAAVLGLVLNIPQPRHSVPLVGAIEDTHAPLRFIAGDIPSSRNAPVIAGTSHGRGVGDGGTKTTVAAAARSDGSNKSTADPEPVTVLPAISGVGIGFLPGLVGSGTDQPQDPL